MFRSFYLWLLFDMTVEQRDNQQQFIDKVNERLSPMSTTDERLGFIQHTFGEVVTSTTRDGMLSTRINDRDIFLRVFGERCLAVISPIKRLIYTPVVCINLLRDPYWREDFSWRHKHKFERIRFTLSRPFSRWRNPSVDEPPDCDLMF